MRYTKEDFISLLDVTKEEILYILETAETMKYVINQPNKKLPYLNGKSVIILFYERSVRARLSYELAAQYLGANIVEITVEGEGLMARALCHELDHLDGILYIDKMQGELMDVETEEETEEEGDEE